MAASPFDISFNPKSGKREAYRAVIPGLHVKVAGRPAVYTTKDISPSGVGLSGSTAMREGDCFEVGLYFKGAQMASGIRARVVRVTSTFTGLVFEDMDRRSQDAVHELVLKEQKRQAGERKKDRLKKT